MGDKKLNEHHIVQIKNAENLKIYQYRNYNIVYNKISVSGEEILWRVTRIGAGDTLSYQDSMTECMMWVDNLVNLNPAKSEKYSFYPWRMHC